MSKTTVQFCSSQAKPFLLNAGSLGLIASITSIYFIWQASAFETWIVNEHDLKLYSRLAASFYLALFAGYCIFAATTDRKSANEILVILALVNVVIGVGAAMSIANQDDLREKINKTNISDPYYIRLGGMLNCCNVIEKNRTIQTPETYTNTTLPNNSTENHTNDSTNSSTINPPSCPSDKICCDCIPITDRTIWALTIIFAGLAIINLFTLIVSGAKVYKTYHYDEASQSTYP